MSPTSARRCSPPSLPQALIVEMNASGSSMTYTLHRAGTPSRSTGACIGCLEDEKSGT